MKITQQPVAIVTGASSGIGLGVTQALLERGWRVVATSRTISKSEELKNSRDLVLVDGDVSKKETAVKVVEAALKHFGRIDLLVNNAGIFIPRPFTDYTEEDYILVMNTNVASFFFMTQQRDGADCGDERLGGRAAASGRPGSRKEASEAERCSGHDGAVCRARCRR